MSNSWRSNLPVREGGYYGKLSDNPDLPHRYLTDYQSSKYRKELEHDLRKKFPKRNPQCILKRSSI